MITQYSQLRNGMIVKCKVDNTDYTAMLVLHQQGFSLLMSGANVKTNQGCLYRCYDNEHVLSPRLTSIEPYIQFEPELMSELKTGMKVTCVLNDIFIGDAVITKTSSGFWINHNVDVTIKYLGNTVPGYRFGYYGVGYQGKILNHSNAALSSLTVISDIDDQLTNISQITHGMKVVARINGSNVKGQIRIDDDKNWFYIYHGSNAYKGVIHDGQLLNPWNSGLTSITVDPLVSMFEDGDKVSCIIDGNVIDDAVFYKNGTKFWIMHNQIKASNTDLPCWYSGEYCYAYGGVVSTDMVMLTSINSWLTKLTLVERNPGFKAKVGLGVSLRFDGKDCAGVVYCVTDDACYIANDLFSNCDCKHDTHAKVWKAVINKQGFVQAIAGITIKPVVDVAH